MSWGWTDFDWDDQTERAVVLKLFGKYRRGDIIRDFDEITRVLDGDGWLSIALHHPTALMASKFCNAA